MFFRSEWSLKITAMHNQPSQFRLLVSNPRSYSEDCILCFKVKHTVVFSSKNPYPNLIHKPNQPNKQTQTTEKTAPAVPENSTNSNSSYLMFIFLINSHWHSLGYSYSLQPIWFHHPSSFFMLHIWMWRFLKTCLAFRTISSWSLFWDWNQATFWFRSLPLQLQYPRASWSFLAISCEAGRIFTDNKLRY